MKKIDAKEHTKKYLEHSRRAANGDFPNKKIAKAGSMAGLGVSGVLLGIGVMGMIYGKGYALGSILAGAATAGGNMYNLKRLKRKN